MAAFLAFKRYTILEIIPTFNSGSITFCDNFCSGYHKRTCKTFPRFIYHKQNNKQNIFIIIYINQLLI